MDPKDELRNLALDIHDAGMWEEFYLMHGNITMYYCHKDRRLKLQKKYNHIKSQMMAREVGQDGQQGN